MTRPQSEPMAIGIPDGTPTPRQTHCSGASMPVDLAGYYELQKAGVRWDTPVEDIPGTGRGEARVACDNQEVSEQRGTVRYGYALCRECMALERGYRATLRARASR